MLSAVGFRRENAYSGWQNEGVGVRSSSTDHWITFTEKCLPNPGSKDLSHVSALTNTLLQTLQATREFAQFWSHFTFHLPPKTNPFLSTRISSQCSLQGPKVKVTTFKGADPNKPQLSTAHPRLTAQLSVPARPWGPSRPGSAPNTAERELSASRRFRRAKWRPRRAARCSRLSAAGGKRRWRPRPLRPALCAPGAPSAAPAAPRGSALPTARNGRPTAAARPPSDGRPGPSSWQTPYPEIL